MYHQTEKQVLYKNVIFLMKTSTSELNKRDRDKQPHMYAKPCIYMPKCEMQACAWKSLLNSDLKGEQVISRNLQRHFEHTETGTANKNTQVPQ